ncbi:MAG: sodium:alanine symporter family protein [Lentisphaeria bacterium]|nr:sodium:alanine symporter family protein [Lentisphaeria bacterium]
MELIARFIAGFNQFLWGPPLLVLLVGAHIFLTFRTKFMQRFVPLGIKLSISKDDHSSGMISNFGALSIALAATIGTGNIIGVATAIVLGGPGAVFWCWVCGIFGIATKYGESLLSLKYRIQTEDGQFHGGPMYAIEYGMKQKWLAILFAIFTVGASFGVGNLAQSNAVSTFTYEVFGVPQWITGIGETIFIALAVLGGLKGISKLCSALVPVMAIFYVASCLVILCICRNMIFPAIQLIITEAFSFRSVSGGFAGSVIMLAMRYGIARGLFSNESGLGSAPIIAAAAKTRNPVRQALISSTGTFWDTVCVCAVTGVTIVSAILFTYGWEAGRDFSKFQAQELTKAAFHLLPAGGVEILTVALAIFACTTVLGWFCYGEQAIHYLGGKKAMIFYRLIFVAAVYIGAVTKLDIVWNFSDIANGLMAIPNIICLFALNGVIVKETARYLHSGKIDDYADGN